MKIELLYMPGCPNRPLAMERIQAALETLGLPATIAEVEVGSTEEAERLRFPGSPTVRVDGADVEPDARSGRPCEMMCRVYCGEDGVEGAPPVPVIIAAICEAGKQPRAGQDKHRWGEESKS